MSQKALRISSRKNVEQKEIYNQNVLTIVTGFEWKKSL